MALKLKADMQTAVLWREPEAGEHREPIGFETTADAIHRGDTGVLVRHEDGRGYAFYPWGRVIRIDYRAETPEELAEEEARQ